jgi:hypothetical protein
MIDFDNNIEVQKLVEKLKVRLKATDLDVNEYPPETLKLEIENANLKKKVTKIKSIV